MRWEILRLGPYVLANQNINSRELKQQDEQSMENTMRQKGSALTKAYSEIEIDDTGKNHVVGDAV